MPEIIMKVEVPKMELSDEAEIFLKEMLSDIGEEEESLSKVLDRAFRLGYYVRGIDNVR